jgi:hypothetical protein
MSTQKQKMKRVRAGMYHYGGYLILKLDKDDPSYERCVTEWEAESSEIGAPLMDGATLRQVKNAIDACR